MNTAIIEKAFQYGKDLIDKPIEMLEEVEAVLYSLLAKYKLVVATKGDLLDQERKLKKSGIEHYLYKAGVSLSVNTDARTITDTNLNRKYKKLQKVFGWTITDFYNCNVNASKAAFIPDQLKLTLLRKLYKEYEAIEINL